MWAAEMGLPPRAERTNADLAGGALSAASGPPGLDCRIIKQDLQSGVLCKATAASCESLPFVQQASGAIGQVGTHSVAAS